MLTAVMDHFPLVAVMLPALADAPSSFSLWNS